MAVLFLTCPVDARLRLLEIAHTVIKGIKDHRACRRERDAQTRRGDLPHEHTAPVVIDDVGKRVQLGAAHGIDHAIVIGKMSARDLRQAQEPCEDVRRSSRPRCCRTVLWRPSPSPRCGLPQ